MVCSERLILADIAHSQGLRDRRQPLQTGRFPAWHEVMERVESERGTSLQSRDKDAFFFWTCILDFFSHIFLM